MRIFGPDALRQFDKATGKAFEKPIAAHVKQIKNPFRKRTGFLRRWLVKPAIIMALATYGLHEYNGYVQRQWENPNINLYDEKQRILWETRYLILKSKLSFNQSADEKKLQETGLGTVDPAAFYLGRLDRLLERLSAQPFSSEKVLHSTRRSSLTLPYLFELNPTTEERVFLTNGDLVERSRSCWLRLFGIPFYRQENIKILKKYHRLKLAKTTLLGHQIDLERLDIAADVDHLLWLARTPTTSITDQHHLHAELLQLRFKFLLDSEKEQSELNQRLFLA